MRRLSIAVAALGIVSSAGAQPMTQADPLGSAVAGYRRGLEAEHAGRHDEAIADLTQAIAVKPDFAAAYETRAVAYDQKGAYDRAVADYTRAIALGDATAETYFNRGAAFEHHRIYAKAAADYRAAVRLDSTLQVARDGLRRLGDGR